MIEFFVGFGVGVERYLLADGAYNRVVHLNGCLVVIVGSQRYTNAPVGACGFQGVNLGRSNVEQGLVKQIAPAVKPRVVVDLVQMVIVVIGRIMA